LNKSLAERAQAHSTYFQRVRDVREVHSSSISKQFYAIQHDRFKTDELSPHHIIPFPTRRSQQIAHQTAYNHEVSVMAGVAKYVGFPAAPTLSGARPSELEDDLEKMGVSQTELDLNQSINNSQITVETRASAPRHSSANPQHPIHQQQPQQNQYTQQHRQQGRNFESAQPSSFATPAAQKRVVDVNAPNGSASTIPENVSAANSSANNTPYGTEQEARHQGQDPFRNLDYDTEHKSGFRSQSSSPLDLRKSQPHPTTLDRRSPAPESSSHPIFSPPPARQGLFQPSVPPKPDTSSPLPSKPVDAMHYRPGISTGSGPNIPPR
jgi:hypothetical protein